MLMTIYHSYYKLSPFLFNREMTIHAKKRKSEQMDMTAFFDKTKADFLKNVFSVIH